MKKWLGISGLVALMVVLQAHEFWLEPFRFKVNPGEAVTIRFAVGDDFKAGDWDLARHKVAKMQLIEIQGVKGLTAGVPTQKGVKQKITISNPGTKLVAMEGVPSFIKLNGKQFTAYLESDGLENALQWRRENKQDTVGAREYYARYAKLFIQSGSTTDDTWKKVVGHRLEIVPVDNITTLKPGDYLNVKILYEGKPSAHTLVKVWGNVGNKVFLQNAYTEDDGTVKFPISATGPWMVSTVRIEKISKPDADWESSWASLVFNVD